MYVYIYIYIVCGIYILYSKYILARRDASMHPDGAAEENINTFLCKYILYSMLDIYIIFEVYTRWI